MKHIVAREEYCIGCKLCEVHCLVQHSRSKKIIKAFRRERNSIVPGVQVEQSGCVSFALQCRHCPEAPCIEACMTGAMQRDPETGLYPASALPSISGVAAFRGTLASDRAAFLAAVEAAGEERITTEEGSAP